MNLRSSPGRSNLPVIASGIISSSTMAADAAVSGCLPRSDLSDPIALATSPWSAYSRARSLAHWRCSARSMAPLSSLLFLCPACSPFPRVLDGHEGMCVYRFCQTVMLRSRFVGICPSCHVVPEDALISDGTPLAHHHLVEARRRLMRLDPFPQHHGPRLLRSRLIDPARPVPVDADIPGEVRAVGRRQRDGGDDLRAQHPQAVEAGERLAAAADPRDHVVEPLKPLCRVRHV